MTEHPCAVCERPAELTADGFLCEVGHRTDTVITDSACFICRREAYHFLKYKGRDVCGICAPFASLGNRMITDCEAKALDVGGQAGGEYLDSIGVGEIFERVSEEQWATFLGKVLEGYSAAMQAEVTADPPF
jgi:hypothetical protein